MLLRALLGERKAVGFTDAWIKYLDTFQSRAGVSVTYETALKTTAVLACVRVLAEGVAQLPFKLYQKSGRERREAEEHPLFAILHRRPNEWQTSFEWRETMMIHAVLAGTGRSFINRVGGRVAELIPLLPGKVEVEQAADYRLSYRLTMQDGSQAMLGRDQIFEIRGPSWDGYRGMDAVKLAREAIGLSIATEETHARLHANGARPGGILTTPMALTKEQVTDLRTSWEATQGGVANAMKTAIMHSGLEFKPMGMDGVDSQHIETRKFQIEEVCRAFRVFPQMIGHGDKAPTYASAEQFFLHHVIHSLGPWIERLEQAIDRDLLSNKDIAGGFYSKLSVMGMLRGAAKDRAAFVTALYQIGAINPNEIRALEDMNPYDGGDEFRVPLNMGKPGAEPPPEDGDSNGDPDA